MKVLVTGGTGVLGPEVVKELRRTDHQARVLSRRAGTGADWARGDKLAAEKIVREDIVRWSILRATQFHAFMEFILSIFSTLPRYATAPLEWQFQPGDARE